MPETVPVIEDDDDMRGIYTAALSRRGYRVLSAAQGAEGVDLARTRQPDLILLDIRMPVMSGWGAIRYLRPYRETQRIPICVISAHEPEEEELQTLGERAFDCFLTKPIDPTVVVGPILVRRP